MTSPKDLAAELGVSDATLRQWLRSSYPRSASRAGDAWALTTDQVDAARRHFAGGEATVAQARIGARSTSDESYVIDLCDELMGEQAQRQHRFPWLQGDPNEKGTTRALPVDAYYEGAGLVVEYLERQHGRPVDHFDKPDVITVSGVHRGEQRRIYDERRRTEIPAHGLRLVNVHATDLDANATGRLRRNRVADMAALRRLLNADDEA